MCTIILLTRIFERVNRVSTLTTIRKLFALLLGRMLLIERVERSESRFLNDRQNVLSRLLLTQLPVIFCEERTLGATLQSKNEFHVSHVYDLAVAWYILYCSQNIDGAPSFALNTPRAHLRVDLL